jgi:hypothetical protein
MTLELLPRPPRRVRGRTGGAFWVGRIFTLPHTLVCIGATGYLVFLVLWKVAGADVPGVVTGTEVWHSRRGTDGYNIRFRYQVDGQTKSGSDGASPALYQRYRSGNGTNPAITVHYFALGPLERAGVANGESAWTEIGLFALWVAFFDSIVSIFVYLLWVKPLRARWLYRHGEAVSGTLLRKRSQIGRSSTYYVSYWFENPLSGQQIEAEIEVWNAADWHLAVEGQPVVILYAPGHPKRNTVYEFGGYRVDSDDGKQFSDT